MKRNPVSGRVPYHGLGYYTKREKEQMPVASVNKVILLGNLGKDPELKRTTSGVAVCNFSIATTEHWNDQTGARQEKTEWHRIQVWKRLAENCAQYLRKGSSVYIEGRITTRTWDDDTGQKRSSTEIVAENVKFLSKPPERSAATSHDPEPIPEYVPYAGGLPEDAIPF